MGSCSRPKLVYEVVLCAWLAAVAIAEDPYLFFEWHIAYGTISPLGVPQQGILINGKFPGPEINCTSNNNIVVNVFNELDEPFLLTWSGIQQRKNSWQDGVPGTMCPIPPGQNYTYRFQVKDQIGSYLYFPTTGLHKASGAIGMIKVHSRELIPVPFDKPAAEHVVILGDWYNKGHKTLKHALDSGRSIGKPDGIQINGKHSKVGKAAKDNLLMTMDAGKTYRLRVCNAGLRLTVNFRVQGHSMRLVELEGSHTVQNAYDTMDLHVGQCMSVLITANKAPKDYYFVASSRFFKQVLTSVATIRYANGNGAPASLELPPPPPEDSGSITWSLNQFRSFRWNLTASAARPNPQGSYHYGKINITRTIVLANTRKVVNGKLRFAINGVSHVDTETPLKMAEYYGMADKVFQYDLAKDEPPKDDKVVLAPDVKNATFRNFVEIILENDEKTIQTWHLDGYSFFAVAIDSGKWSPAKRKTYNLLDAVSRHTIHVYPKSWAAVMTTLDNAGMWNLRSEMRERAYLGQQLYFSVLSPELSLRDEYNLPPTQTLCGLVKGKENLAKYKGT